jgi:flagellum-specific peptidoglycan hydrolase FlgJ
MENKMFKLNPIVFEYNRLTPNNIKTDYSAFLYTPTISVDKAVVVPNTPKESTPTEKSPKSTTSPKVVVPVQSTIATGYSPIYRTVGGKKERDTAKNKTEFIKTFLPVYRKVLKEKGISEDFAESLVAQAALESA